MRCHIPDTGLTQSARKDEKSRSGKSRDPRRHRQHGIWASPFILCANAKVGYAKICVNNITSRAIRGAQNSKYTYRTLSYRSMKISSRNSIVHENVISMPQPITGSQNQVNEMPGDFNKFYANNVHQCRAFSGYQQP